VSSGDGDLAIETVALSRRFGRKRVLDGLDLRLPRGAIHAILGANGAGKSTLFRILLGFLAPTGGRARVLGRDCGALTPEDRGRIGFVNEEHTLPGWMRVAVVTAMHRCHHPRWSQAVCDEVLGHFRVLPEQRVRELSRGERAGLSLALVLAQQPELLVLDEPTLGLDVVAKRALVEAVLYGASAAQRTVIYCSHQMDEVERIADNLVILERGRLKTMAAPDELRARLRLWVAELPFQGPDPAALPGVLQVQRLDGFHHYLVLDQDDGFAERLRGYHARSIQSMPVSLERAVDGLLAVMR
jgi:ABC-2 type transport system ATP-binding protein